MLGGDLGHAEQRGERDDSGMKLLVAAVGGRVASVLAGKAQPFDLLRRQLDIKDIAVALRLGAE